MSDKPVGFAVIGAHGYVRLEREYPAPILGDIHDPYRIRGGGLFRVEPLVFASDLAKAQARVAELEAALRGYVEAVIEVVPTTMSKGGVAHSLVLSPDRTELGSRALASDGTSALAAVRLAQGVCDELLTSGASIYGDGRLSDEMRAQVIAASNAMDKAFGSRT